MVRSSVESHKIIYGQSRVSGPVVMIATSNTAPDSTGATVTSDNQFVHMVIALAGHEVEEIGTIYLNDLAVTLNGSGFVQTVPYLKDGKSYVRVSKHLGTSTQTADALLAAEYPDWTSAHRLRGVAYLYVRMQWNPDIFPQGIPNVSAVVKGKKVYDPRTATTAWTDNAALCTRDYMSSDYGFNCDDDELNDDYFEAAANACEESVSLSTGGSQDRYTINGVLDTAASRIDNLNGLVAAMAGAVTYVQGQFRAYAGAYDAPVGDIDLGLLAGPVKISARPPRKELFNRVQGTYVDPNKNWQPTDFPPVGNALYEEQDGGELIPRDVILTLTNHPEAAQRIAKVILEQGRQGIQVELKLKHHALSFAVWDTVTFTNAPVGWEDKVFRIKSMRHDGIGPITLSLQEESSESYDWNNGEAATYDAAPDTNLPSPFLVAVPTGVVYNSRAVETTGGDTVYNLVLSWNLHPDAFVREGGGFDIQYRLSAEMAWRAGPFVEGDQTTADVPATSVNTSYDLRIRAVSILGSRSQWVYIYNAMIGSSGGAAITNDWGFVYDTVGPMNDWGGVADPVTTTDDWGNVL